MHFSPKLPVLILANFSFFEMKGAKILQPLGVQASKIRWDATPTKREEEKINNCGKKNNGAPSRISHKRSVCVGPL